MNITNIADLFVTLPEERQQARLEICDSCEYKIQATNMCGKCGCYLPWKTHMAASACPVLKWTHEITESSPE